MIISIQPPKSVALSEKAFPTFFPSSRPKIHIINVVIPMISVETRASREE